MKFDTALFIATVKKYPILYDHRHDLYNITGKKMLVWEQVANKCNIPSGIIAKTKWRNIRDSYVKHLKAIRYGTSNGKYNAWPWSSKMEFLKPFITGRHSLYENKHNENDEQLANNLVVMPTMYLQQECWEEETESILPDNGLMEPDENPIIKGEPIEDERHFIDEQSNPDSIEIQPDIIEIKPEELEISSNVFEQPSECSEEEKSTDILKEIKIDLTDPTDLMMLSHARRIRRLSKKRQISLEMKIAQLILEMELEEVEENERIEINH